MPRTPFALQTGRSVEPRRRVALVWASSVTATDIIGVPALVARSTVKKPLVETTRAHAENVGLHRRHVGGAGRVSGARTCIAYYSYSMYRRLLRTRMSRYATVVRIVYCVTNCIVYRGTSDTYA